MRWGAERSIAREAAAAAAQVLAGVGGKGPQRIVQKGEDIDLVTEYDRRCESAIREVLSCNTPDIPILGEEEGGPWDAQTRWVVDPIDGTTNFVHGFPWYAVSIGLEVDGERVVGVIFEPVRGRAYEASLGDGATVNGEPVRVSECRELAQALVATGFPYDRRARVDDLLAHLRALMLAVRGIRRAGAASLDLAMVGSGRVDAYYEVGLKPWDIAAGCVFVKEAGGITTDLSGRSKLDERNPVIVASNGFVHDALVGLLDAASR